MSETKIAKLLLAQDGQRDDVLLAGGRAKVTTKIRRHREIKRDTSSDLRFQKMHRFNATIYPAVSGGEHREDGQRERTIFLEDILKICVVE